MSQSGSLSSCRVWLRPMGLSWRISVEGRHNAEALIEKLQEYGFESTEPVGSSDRDHWTFHCLTKSRHEKDSVERHLNHWPEVHLQLSPDDTVAHVERDPVGHLDATPLHQPAQPDSTDNQPDAFRVWVRPLGNAWKIRAEGADETAWLCRELTHRGLTCTQPVQTTGTNLYTFRCMSQTAHEANYVWHLLQALPHTLLQNEPA